MHGGNGGSSWIVFGKTVEGAAHKRRNNRNQDAIDWQPRLSCGPTLTVAVSDGHGSAKCFRSHIGAHLAVKVATRTLLSKILLNSDTNDNPSTVRRLADEKLPQEIVKEWRKHVNIHALYNPWSAEELSLLGSCPGTSGDTGTDVLHFLPYGTTLLSVSVNSSYILYLQLGDGDIMTVSAEGEVIRPIRDDERLFASETTSLCTESAWKHFRCHFQKLSGKPPALILLSTDGYANSFANRDAFSKVGPDILKTIQTEGFDSIRTNLADWLSEASEKGSGDDITLGIIYHINSPETLDKEIASESTSQN